MRLYQSTIIYSILNRMTGFGYLTLKLLSLEAKVEIFALYNVAEEHVHTCEHTVKQNKHSSLASKYSVANVMGKKPQEKSLDPISYSLWHHRKRTVAVVLTDRKVLMKRNSLLNDLR